MEKKLIIDLIMFDDDNFFGGVKNHQVIDTSKLSKIKTLNKVTDRDYRYLNSYEKEYRITSLEITLREIIPF